jgi:serine protease Do
MPRTRRDVLTAGLTLAVTTTAGCVEWIESEDVDQTDGRTDSTEAELEQERRRNEQLEAELEDRDDRLEEVEGQGQSQGDAMAEDTHDFSSEELEQAHSLAADVREAVVRVNGGTGWHLGDGVIITNFHVVQEFGTLQVRTYAGEEQNTRWQSGELIGQGTYIDDLAAIRISDTDLPTLSIGELDTLEMETPLMHIGHPGRVGSWIPSLGRFVRFDSMGTHTTRHQLVTSVPADGGNSGSPAMTLDGEVVGVTYAGLPQTEQEFSPETVYTDFDDYRYDTHHISIEILQSYLNEWL